MAEGSAAPKGSAWSYIGVGCLTAPIGFFGGGMIAVFFAKIVGGLQHCNAPEGVPACNWLEFLVVGGLIGMIGLPSLSVWRLRVGRKKAAADGTI